MLNTVEVDGFRSLMSFSIELQRGLNVLVGPNGTGKSNFISFLDFMSALVEEDLNSAIAVAQGAGAVFSKEMFGDDEATLSFVINGHWSNKEFGGSVFVSGTEDKSSKGEYSYKCELKYLRAIPAIYIASEKIKVTSDAAPPFEVLRETFRREKSFQTKVVADHVSKEHLDKKFRWRGAEDKKQSADGYLSDTVE